MVYSTQLTISIPTSVAQKVPFTVSGRLTFMEGGIYYGLQGKTISIAGGGASATATTASDGTYSTSLTIMTVGTYTVTASYAGEIGLAAAEAYAPVGVVGAADYTPLMWLGILAAGAYIFRKDLAKLLKT